jgi:hypothetical protein
MTAIAGDLLTDGSLFHQSGRVQSYAMQCICQIMTDI